MLTSLSGTTPFRILPIISEREVLKEAVLQTWQEKAQNRRSFVAWVVEIFGTDDGVRINVDGGLFSATH